MGKSDVPSDWAEPLVIAIYLDFLFEKGRTEATQRQYRGVLRRAAYWLEARRHVVLLNADHADLRAWRSSLCLADASITNYVSIIRGLFEWAHKSGLVDDDPAWNLPAPPLRPGYPRPISEKSLQLALQFAPRKVRIILILAAYAGLRAAEIAGLRREHIRDDLDTPVLLFRGKGGKERIVPLTHYVWGEILSCLEPLPHRGVLIRRGDGKPGPNRPDRISSLANDYLRSMGIGDTLHSLRHRFGTQAALATNGNLLLVGAAMGHASTNTTKRYTAFANPDLRAMVEAVQPQNNDPAGLGEFREVIDPPG